MAGLDFDEIREHLDLEQWFEREGRVFKMGRGRSGMQINAQECPACGDRRWRVYLNAETGLGNCFVCNQAYNKISFIHHAVGGTWRETFDNCREAMKEQGWRPKRTVTTAVENGEVKLPSSFALPTGDGENLVYLQNRGVDGDLARYFHLRYCHMGNFVYQEDGRYRSQRFDGRIIIPVYDMDGTLMTFQGRDITGEDGGRKYLFPKGLPGTGRFLLNGQNANRVRRVAIGEGFFDVAAIKVAMDEDVELRDVVPVGTFGKNLSYGDMNGNDQLGRFLQLAKQGLEEATFMWDGEHAALIAAIHGAELLSRIGVRARVALLPKDKDPNEITGAQVRQAFREARVLTTQLAVRWRLRNPYKAPVSSVISDLHSELATL